MAEISFWWVRGMGSISNKAPKHSNLLTTDDKPPQGQHPEYTECKYTHTCVFRIHICCMTGEGQSDHLIDILLAVPLRCTWSSYTQQFQQLNDLQYRMDSWRPLHNKSWPAATWGEAYTLHQTLPGVGVCLISSWSESSFSIPQYSESCICLLRLFQAWEATRCV